MRETFKKTLRLLVVPFLILALAACGADDTTNDPAPEDQEQGQVDEETDENTEGNEETAGSEEGETEALQVSGTYVGLADNHTIEIETEEGPVAFQVPDELKADLEELQENDQVTVTYQENENGQKVLSQIEKQ
ncbi:MAG: hypothetical protein H0Z33_09200 [Bacillaceae bacterium]|nr:hypothetical protein [Bacillaceae bacterium]